MPNFSLFRHDRTSRKGGGTCFWIRDSLNPQLVDVDFRIRLPETIESTWIAIKNRSILCVCLYIPPGLTQQQKCDIYDCLSEAFDLYLSRLPETELIIMGDFNDFCADELACTLGLVCTVDQPTRNSSTLDLIFLSEDLLCKIQTSS